MKTFRLMIGAAIAVASLAVTSAADAAPAGVRVGELTCNVASGWGFVFGSSKDLHCTYRGSNGHPRALYRRDLQVRRRRRLYRRRRAGLGRVRAHLRHRARARCRATMSAPPPRPPSRVGAGANVLVGGLNKSIALQPLSVEGSKGLNVAAGIGSISLT